MTMLQLCVARAQQQDVLPARSRHRLSGRRALRLEHGGREASQVARSRLGDVQSRDGVRRAPLHGMEQIGDTGSTRAQGEEQGRPTTSARVTTREVGAGDRERQGLHRREPGWQ